MITTQLCCSWKTCDWVCSLQEEWTLRPRTKLGLCRALLQITSQGLCPQITRKKTTRGRTRPPNIPVMPAVLPEYENDTGDKKLTISRGSSQMTVLCKARTFSDNFFVRACPCSTRTTANRSIEAVNVGHNFRSDACTCCAKCQMSSKPACPFRATLEQMQSYVDE